MSRPHHRSPTSRAQKRDYSIYFLKCLPPLNRRYHTDIEFRSYRLIHQLHIYDDKAPSVLQRIRKRVTARMKNQELNRKDSISVSKFSDKFKQDRKSSQTHKGAVVWRFRESRPGPAIAALNTRWRSSSYDPGSRAGTVTAHVSVVSPLLM